MVVYADILIVLNLIVDYLLLLATASITGRKYKLWRMLAGAFVGALSSLYIFLPKATIPLELLFKLFICLIMVIISFGYQCPKKYFRTSLVLLIVTSGYAGAMMAVWHILKPKGMLIFNSVVYYNISPLILVAASTSAYFGFILLHKIFGSSAKRAERCEVTVTADNNTVSFRAILDTGNSVSDVFGESEVIIADKTVICELFGEIDIKQNIDLMPRYRLVPCSTVSGNDMLEGFRCDSAVINGQGRSVMIKKPIVAASKIDMKDDYSAILNPKILE